METNTGTQVWPFCSLPSNPHPLGCGLCKAVNVTVQHHSAVRWLSSPFCNETVALRGQRLSRATRPEGVGPTFQPSSPDAQSVPSP